MRIVFMGTPEYSVSTISALITAGHDVKAVFCQPDKPVGRKQILTPPPTKVFAENNGIKVYQPTTLRDGTALAILKDIDPDIIVVVAYGKILPKEILYLPKYGSINGHASLLPRLRGASPIQWAIVTGETETGVTVMQMDEGMDTGDILSYKSIGIMDDDTAESLFNKLSLITADIIVETIGDIANGAVNPVKQDETNATYAPIIKKEMAHLDFNKSANEVCCAVRGFYPWPAAFCYIDGKRLKVLSAIPFENAKSEPGRVIKNDSRLVISCGDNTAVELLSIQPEGGKPMSASDMLRGNKVVIGTVVN